MDSSLPTSISAWQVSAVSHTGETHGWQYASDGLITKSLSIAFFAVTRLGSSLAYPSTSNIITALTIAGKIAPRPLWPLRRSVTNVTALSMARRRVRFGKIDSARRKRMSMDRNKINHAQFWWGAFDASPTAHGD